MYIFSKMNNNVDKNINIVKAVFTTFIQQVSNNLKN